MCGIAGIFGADPRQQGQIAQKMASAIAHRGPDDFALWEDGGARIAISHRRLAVLELSSAGRQPMHSPADRFVIVFNGEIYNFHELKQALEQSPESFRGGSDTEILLHGFEKWGIIETLKRAVGMFALAVWDQRDQRLTLVRDRLGEKPLYYGWLNGSFVFASELGAICASSHQKLNLNQQALSLFMRYGYVPAPCSIFEGVFKLLPGHSIELSREMLHSQHPLETVTYWSPSCSGSLHNHTQTQDSDVEIIDECSELLARAVRQQSVADVPVGAFLSGGVDSSLIVALMQQGRSRHSAVRTFSIGFEDQRYNEAPQAALVAQHLGTQHNELCVSASEMLALVPKMGQIYDEPFADSSQIPTFLVAQLARRQVTVSLSGDGADELFCGYPRYSWGNMLWRGQQNMPVFLRGILVRALHLLAGGRFNRFSARMTSGLSKNFNIPSPAHKFGKIARGLARDSSALFYRELISLWDPVTVLRQPGVECQDIFLQDKPRHKEISASSLLEQFMAFDLQSYLPDDVLVKVDRATMAVALESRAPFLDHRFVEFALGLPLRYKLRHGQTKWVLRRILERFVPPELVERPKMGFSVPLGEWLRGPLRVWASDLLDSAGSAHKGLLNADLVQRYWKEHLSGRHDWHNELWAVLMFQSWTERNL